MYFFPLSGTSCQKDWSYFRGNCYIVVDNIDPLSWFDAEELCRQQDSNLVSIRDEQDMDFIHSLIITSFKDDASPPLHVFIGKLKFSPELNVLPLTCLFHEVTEIIATKQQSAGFSIDRPLFSALY